MRSLFFFLSGALLMGVFVLVLAQTNNSLVKQVNSYSTLDLMKRTPMNVNGDAGRFLPEQELFYVKTGFGEKVSCLNSLHEIAHSKQWKNNDECFYNTNDLYACEEYAIEYVKQNSWRCEGIQ